MTSQARGVLVVDDDSSVREVLIALLRQAGFAAESACSGEQALAKLRSAAFDLVLTDLKMDGITGMDLLRDAVHEWPDVPVIMLTAHGTVAVAVEAMKAGAVDFLMKPFDREEVLYTVGKALESARRKHSEPPTSELRSDGVVGRSAAIQALMALLSRAGSSQATVLLRGESGTGKELAARTLHRSSARSEGPFIVVNCGALPENLLESELFGYEKGAFTGASSRKPGRVELAQGGTLFLDEIGDLPASMQVKLLRLLQDKEYQPLGSTCSKRADVRFVAATHRDLEGMIRAGAFREDLFYRLSVVPVWVPPLRERREDLPLLIAHFCACFSELNGRGPVRFAADALALLVQHAWPGNVRELQNLVERAVILSDGDVVSTAWVHSELARSGQPGGSSQPPPMPATPGDASGLGETRAHAEREAVMQALALAGGSRTNAARILRISRRTLYNKLSEYGLS